MTANEETFQVKRIGNIFGVTGGNYAGWIYDTNGIGPTLLRMTGGSREPIIVEISDDEEELLCGLEQ